MENCDVDLCLKASSRPGPGGLKRAASADLTFALKEIISRHITAKSKAEDGNSDRNKESTEQQQRDALRYKRGRYRR